MKKLLIILYGLIAGLVSNAQEQYVPLTGQDGVKWVYYLVHGSDTIPYSIEFKGDTLVNNHNVAGLATHNLHARKCYMTFSKPVVNPSSGETIFGTEPLLVAWGFDWHYKTYVHYTKAYRSRVRRHSIPLEIVDDEFDDDCFHCLGRVSFVDLAQATGYWSANIPDQYKNAYQFVKSEEVEVDGHARTLYSSEPKMSPYYAIDHVQMQTFMMDGIGWFGRYFNSSDTQLSRSNMSNFLSPFGQLRGSYEATVGPHIDDLYNPYSESLFSHQEKGGEVIFKSPWYLGDDKTTVNIDRILEAKSLPSTDLRWYDLLGHPYESRPAQPGIYIHQGRKVVVQ